LLPACRPSLLSLAWRRSPPVHLLPPFHLPQIITLARSIINFATKWGVVQFHLHDTHHTPLHATTGKNFSERSKGFNFALRVTFTGRAALDAYLPHPDHVKVKDQFIVPITEDILAVDYEF
jgi:hypothetical protein